MTTHQSNAQPTAPAAEAESPAPSAVTPDQAAGYLFLILGSRAKMAERLHRIAVAWADIDAAQRIEVDRILGSGRLVDALLDIEAYHLDPERWQI